MANRDHAAVERRRARPRRKHEGLLGRIRQIGVPSDETDAAWPIFHVAGQLKSLHANGRSFVLSTEQFNREHNCKFWEKNEQ